MPSILVVEDNRDIALIVSRHLRTARHAVRIAHDGVEALDLMSRERPDCIVLDLMMPVMTGTELLRYLKDDQTLWDIPVVVVSARFGSGHANLFAEHDAERCVGKPFSRQQLLDAVDASLARRRRSVPLHVQAPGAAAPAMA